MSSCRAALALCRASPYPRKAERIRRGRCYVMSDTTDLGAATPFSGHPSPRKRLSCEVPAVCHGDRCSDDPQHGCQDEVIGHGGHS